MNKDSWVEVIPATKNAMAPKQGFKKMRVAAYCRVSTDSEEQLTSYRTQIDYYTDKINAAPEWTLVEVFADEGISGVSTKKRDEFNRMMEMCDKGKIDLIITKSVSRFSRNTTVTLEYARSLRDKGIGIIFEKENLNTLTLTSEMLLALHSIFAQAESESMSENIKLGKRFGYKAGRVGFNFNGIYGYKQDEDGNITADMEQTVAVKIMFDSFLDGHTLSQIADELEERGHLTPSGLPRWSKAGIKRVLTNEKYTGDVLTQKTFTTDVTTKRKKVNTGELPQYYIRNHHVPIISREQYDAVQIELKRRNCIRKNEKKNDFSKYSGKSALNNLVVCGECGSKYRRTIWIDRRKNKKYVWRCVSRLEYGKKYCHTSPSIDDEMLKSTVIEAINAVYASKNSIRDIVKCNIAALLGKTNEPFSIKENNNKIDKLNERMRDALYKNSAGEITTDELDEICAEIMQESKVLREENKKHTMEIQMKGAEQARLKQIFEAIDHMSEQMTEFDDETVRAVVERIDVISQDKIIIWLIGGISYEKELTKAA